MAGRTGFNILRFRSLGSFGVKFGHYFGISLWGRLAPPPEWGSDDARVALNNEAATSTPLRPDWSSNNFGNPQTADFRSPSPIPQRQWSDSRGDQRQAQTGREADILKVSQAIPWPRPGFGPLPPVYVPGTPENKQWTDQFIQGLRGLYNAFSGPPDKGGGNNDDGCDEEIRAARKICIDAYANGWRSDYAVGPYKKATKGPWTIQDCMRGLISERCGGNPVDRGTK
jgi:hypothetical protein